MSVQDNYPIDVKAVILGLELQRGHALDDGARLFRDCQVLSIQQAELRAEITRLAAYEKFVTERGYQSAFDKWQTPQS